MLHKATAFNTLHCDGGGIISGMTFCTDGNKVHPTPFVSGSRSRREECVMENLYSLKPSQTNFRDIIYMQLAD